MGMVAIASLSLSSSFSLALSKSIVVASDDSDVALMSAMTGQMKDQENEISSLRSRITKFEKDLEQVLDETRKLGMVARPQQLLAKSEGVPTGDLEALISNTPKFSSVSNSSEPWAALVAVLRDEERYIDEWVATISHSVFVKFIWSTVIQIALWRIGSKQRHLACLLRA
jgi:hypothetical protein